MKICNRNFDEIREKTGKTIEKILQKFLKNWSVLNFCWNFKKKFKSFLRKLCFNHEKIKIYKNFDEIRGKF